MSSFLQATELAAAHASPLPVAGDSTETLLAKLLLGTGSDGGAGEVGPGYGWATVTLGAAGTYVISPGAILVQLKVTSGSGVLKETGGADMGVVNTGTWPELKLNAVSLPGLTITADGGITFLVFVKKPKTASNVATPLFVWEEVSLAGGATHLIPAGAMKLKMLASGGGGIVKETGGADMGALNSATWPEVTLEATSLPPFTITADVGGMIFKKFLKIPR